MSDWIFARTYVAVAHPTWGIKCLDLERIQATSLATGKARLKFHTVANKLQV